MLARLTPLLLAATVACLDPVAQAEAEKARALTAELQAKLDGAEAELATRDAELAQVRAELETCTKCRGQVVTSLGAYGKSESYPASTTDTAEAAQAWLSERVAARKPDEKLAMVLDVDETTLNNFQQLEGSGFCYEPAAWDVWVKEGSPPSVPGVKPLYDYARSNDVAVVFITGRKEPQRADTERALKAAGFDGWQELILRNEEERKVTAAEYKSARRAKLESEGFTVVLTLGDQQSDLAGGHAEKTILMPNPFYHVD